MKKYKSIFKEISIPTEALDSKMEQLDGNIQEFLSEYILPNLKNGIYSKNFYKLIQAFYVMNVVQGLSAKICLLFIKHYFNFLLDQRKYSTVPSTFISEISWEAVKTNSSSWIFFRSADSQINDSLSHFSQQMYSDALDTGLGGMKWDPDYATMDDWENDYPDIINYIEPRYFGITPTFKGFQLEYILSDGTILESYLNEKLQPFLNSGPLQSYNLFYVKNVLTFFISVVKSNKSSLIIWLNK